MVWKPEATVTIGGTDFSQESLEGVSITYGRSTVDEQARAPYASIILRDKSGTGLNLDLLDRVVITLKNTSGINRTVFTGNVSDLEIGLLAAGDVTPIAEYKITAIGTTAKLNKATVDASILPSANSGERIRAIFDASLQPTWGTYVKGITWLEAVGQWNTTTPEVTYCSLDGWELAAAASGIYNSYEKIVEAANDSMGQFYESPDGTVNYASAFDRLDYVAANGFLELDPDGILVDGITSSSNSADVINLVEVTYASGTATAEDITSQNTYGKRAEQLSTELLDLTNAQLKADRFIRLFKTPRRNLSNLTIELALPDVDAAQRDDLIDVFSGLPVRVKGLPAAIYGSDFTGFVEGWSWSINEYTAQLDLTVSDFALSVPTYRWKDIAAAETWLTITPTLTWLNAGEVT